MKTIVGLACLVLAFPVWGLSGGKFLSFTEAGSKFTGVTLDFANSQLKDGLEIKLDPTLIDWGIVFTDAFRLRLGAGISEIDVTNGFNGKVGFFYSGGVQWRFWTFRNGVRLNLNADVLRGQSEGFGLVSGQFVTDSKWTQWQGAISASRTFWDKLTLYTGFKYSDGKLNMGNVADEKLARNFGGFGGVELAITESWVVNAEGRFGDEEVFSIGWGRKY